MRQADDKNPIRANDYLTGDAFTVSPTAEGWWATTPAPDDLSRYYPPAYYGVRARRYPGPVEWVQSWLYRRRSRWVTSVAGTPGKVLDVGCGPGHLLARFRDRGWEVVGTEATPAAAAIPRARYGIDVKAGDLRELGFAPETFDAVVSWHTLEHMRNPGRVLDEIARVLKPGGLLLISVPDFASREASANPAAWFHLDVPRHLAHFPAEVLRGLLRTRGFEILTERFAAPEYDLFSLVQTWQNRLGLPHNLLYLLLKSARSAGADQPGWVPRLTAVGLAFPLTVAAAWLALWRVWAKAGAVIVILARKK